MCIIFSYRKTDAGEQLEYFDKTGDFGIVRDKKSKLVTVCHSDSPVWPLCPRFKILCSFKCIAFLQKLLAVLYRLSLLSSEVDAFRDFTCISHIGSLKAAYLIL